MYRIVKDNDYTFVYRLQQRFFWFFWRTIVVDTLESCRKIKRIYEKTDNRPRFTVVE